MKELQLILGFVGFEMQLIKFHIDYELIKKIGYIYKDDSYTYNVFKVFREDVTSLSYDSEALTSC
jgi:hypothetical protein